MLARAAAEKAGPAMGAAYESAVTTAAPKVGAAIDSASPRLERGLLAAGPKVEAAADRSSSPSTRRRDRLVNDLLPRLVEAVTAAAAAGAVAQRAATEAIRTVSAPT